MDCPCCELTLPPRFALLSRGTVAACPHCSGNIVPSTASLRRAGLLTYVPIILLSASIIPISVMVAVKRGEWIVPLTLLVGLIAGIVAWATVVGAKTCRFERA